jgi:transcriptional regulator with XRE-family HTH domain
MNDPRLGASYRALRRRRGWRQADLAGATRRSQQFVSKLECGHIGDVSIDELRSVASALDATLTVELRWHGGGLDRLLDERHAALLGSTVGLLTSLGWLTDVEATYSHYGERGSIDILAWHEASHSLLVVEIKSELVSVEATLRKLDEKVRLAAIVAAERWPGRHSGLGRVLVLPSTTTERRRVERHAAVLDAALPLRNDMLRSWLRRPAGPADGILFVADTTGRGAGHGRATGQRVRRQDPAPDRS